MVKIRVENAWKEYKKKSEIVQALKNVNVEFEAGKIYAIIGRSGSGKSTLLYNIGLMDTLTKGSIYFNEKNVSQLNDKEKSRLRMKEIGFIFQGFNLNKNLKVNENILLPMFINEKYTKEKREKKVRALLEMLDIGDKANRFPRELSGGEEQRVAIARALANEPEVILADEPTGNLDEENEKIIFEILKKLSLGGKCVIVVSHNPEIKEYADKIFEMNNGELSKNLY